MKTTITVSLFAAALFAGSAAAGSISFNGDATTVRVDQVNVQKPADRARVVEALRAAAGSTCLNEPTRADRRACADQFAAAAIGDLAEAPLRTALLQTLTGDSAMAVASAE